MKLVRTPRNMVESDDRCAARALENSKDALPVISTPADFAVGGNTRNQPRYTSSTRATLTAR